MSTAHNPLLGNLVNLGDVSGADFLRHPVWVNDLSGEGNAAFDETSVRPVLEEINVTPQFRRRFVSVSIALRDVGSNELVTADYLESGELECVMRWQSDQWCDQNTRVVLEAVPMIEGRSRMRFEFNPQSRLATRIV